VRDRAGRAVAGADVVVGTSYFGAIRAYAKVSETRTDAKGHYRIGGPILEAMAPLIVMVRSKGRPPAKAYAPAPTAGEPARPPLDVTLSDAGMSGSMRVLVLREGKPAPGANVLLLSGESDIFASWGQAEPASRRVWSEIESLFKPRATTGADGVAHFAEVFPGTYDVMVTGNTIAAPGARPSPRGPGQESGAIQGVGVAPGREIEATVSLHPPLRGITFQVLRPDGSPVANQDVAFGTGLRSTSTGGNASLKLDDRGIGTYAFGGPGLWAVDVRFRDSELRKIPVKEEPYYRAEVLLPVSPAWAPPDPIRLRGTRRERGSLRVELKDAEGRPARGTVMILEQAGLGQQPIDQAASTDASGAVRFAEMPQGHYLLHAAIDGLSPPFRPAPGPGPMPADGALRGQLALLDQKAEVEAGAETRVVLRPQKVGYVRGTLKPPAGRGAADYRFAPVYDEKVLPADRRLDEATGELVAGPFPPGPVRLRMFRVLEDG
jgi:hypothetical protein